MRQVEASGGHCSGPLDCRLCLTVSCEELERAELGSNWPKNS